MPRGTSVETACTQQECKNLGAWLYFILVTESETLSWQDCSVNSPAAGPLPIGAPDWCKAPFDPEGIWR